MKLRPLTVLVALLVLVGPAHADEYSDRLRDIHRELVEINTAPSGGSTTYEAASAMAKRLLEAGFPAADVAVMGPSPELSALIARYRSAEPVAPPILLLAHLDVVEALPEDWSLDPFRHIEQDGWFYGRGSYDNKAGAAILVSNFVRLRLAGFQPQRDFIVLLTADEETYAEGLQWLLREHRQLVDAEFALNTDSGLVLVADGRAEEFRVQTAEKIFATYELELRNPGGHSSKPRRDNAIYELARLLTEVEQYRFPIDSNATTQSMFRHYLPHANADEAPLVRALAEGRLDDPVLARLPDHAYLNSLARTTCVATQVAGGHAHNALPQSASAVVNCRLLPQEDTGSAYRVLSEIALRHGAEIRTLYQPMASPPSPLVPRLFGLLTRLAEETWPGIDVVPEMDSGATDALFTRNAGMPTYGIAALEFDPADDRSHGRDERIGVQALYRAGAFWYRLLQSLGGPEAQQE